MSEPSKNMTATKYPALTPHGPGFRFIDRFERNGPTTGTGWKHLPKDAPYFQDHFPGQPVMPAVLLVECAAQTAGVLIMQGSADPGTPLFLASIEQFRIHGPVFPDESVETMVTIEKELGPLIVVGVECRVNDRAVARGRLMISRQLGGTEKREERGA
jgi:3-hydroxymyristoyl/3-hydroxydecanoyl-(acyl carrier protein) dehydratase